MINTRALCVVFTSFVGCATPMSALREDNRRLTQSVTELRADRHAQERKLRDLEHQLAIAKEKGVDVPQLPVEVVAPPKAAPVSERGGAPTGDPRVVAIADDGAEIIYEGDAATGKPATLDDDPPRRTTPSPRASQNDSAPKSAPISANDDRIEVTRRVPPINAAARAPRSHYVRTDRDAVPAGEAAAVDYRAAVELVKAGKHDEAVAALRRFLKTYPRHDYADNAQYWLGESFYAHKDYAQALGEFRATIETYPRGNKVPDALLKVGYCYQALGQTEKARAVLEQVVSLYPKTEPAALASKRLETP